jgi:hypothetical protein
MNKKIFMILLLTTLIVTTFAVIVKPAHATSYPVLFTNPFPWNSLFNAVNFGGLLPGDHVHILAGHIEALPPGGLTIPIPNLYIIGAPPKTGPMPSIDLAGQTISIAAPNVFIWGIDFWDSAAISPFCIDLTPAAATCTIQNCTIRGSLVPGSIGIMTTNSADNLIACNRIQGWDLAIELFGPGSTNNIVKLNDIDSSWSPPTSVGIVVVLGAGAGAPNQIFWNDIIGVPCPPFSGLGRELWDPTIGNPPNIFDDLAQPVGKTWSRGNYESSWAIPPPYPVLGAGNGFFDRLPNLGNSPIVGDADLSGQVNILDAIRLSGVYGFVWCSPKWEPRVDFNGDGIINIFDAILLSNKYGYNYPPSPAPT